MKRTSVFIAFVCVVFFVVSCKNAESPENTDATHKQDNPSIEAFEQKEILFDRADFSDEKSKELLREINICSDEYRDENGRVVTPCSPEFFHFLPLRSTLVLEQGFILVVRANTGGFGLRRVLVFEREQGTLVKVNGFVANVIGVYPRENTNDDLLLRFIDKIDGSDVFYHCIFQWENGRYVFKTVEAIHEPAGNFYGKVKVDIKDSLSTEIHKILVENQMIF